MATRTVPTDDKPRLPGSQDPSRKRIMFVFEGLDAEEEMVLETIILALGEKLAKGGFIGPVAVDKVDMEMLSAMETYHDSESWPGDRGDQLGIAAYLSGRYVFTNGELMTVGSHPIHAGTFLQRLVITGYVERMERLATAAVGAGCVVEEHTSLIDDKAAMEAFKARLLGSAASAA